MKNITRNNKGFTIIEVVLVLAIAGLIFLVVFLALPQLQKSRRDTQRKSDAGRAVAALESYAGNNNGRYPALVGDFDTIVVGQYLTDGGTPLAGWNDPSTGSVYTPASARPGSPISGGTAGAINELGEGEYWYEREALCDGQAVIDSPSNTRNAAFVIFQESGAQYCQDNQ